LAEVLKRGTTIADLSGLAEGGTRGFTLGEGEWPARGFVVLEGGQVHAYVNRCPHAGRQLNFLPDRFLSADGTLIQCVAHGALFDKSTGECIAGPCVGDLLTRISVERDGMALRLAEDLDTASLSRPPW
jgi:nitrite reductase/ring-hydroxylating ferredoxin subunit